MKKTSLSLLASTILLSGNSFADEVAKPKRTVAGNMNITYKILPQDVENINDMFSNGIAYGRLRMNMFKWDWSSEDKSGGKNNYAVGLGGSLIYKTARYNGLSGTIGFYTSQNPFMTMDSENMGSLKAGKDTLSRYDVKSQDKYGMTVIGESYLQYDTSKTTFRFGRQLFHTVFTKSNDTKMIPNTFDGLTVDSKDFLDSHIQLAYIQRQKLRDHTSSHDVITFKDASGESWANNDDSAIHKGLTYANFVAHNEDPDHEMMIATFENKSAVKDLQFIASHLTIPDVISNTVLEAHYKFKAGGWTVSPGIRYMMQMDDGAGEIGGASLSGKLASWTTGADKRGYKDPKNLDSTLLAVRLTGNNGDGTLKLLYGYSEISDDADIVAPWRGFPTGGYTRAMAQYNWNANTKTHMVQATYDFDKAGLVNGFKSTVRYAMQDFDDNKPDVQGDSNVIHIDFWKTFDSIPNFEAKVRIGMADVSEKAGKDTSYDEYRLEFNYLF